MIRVLRNAVVMAVIGAGCVVLATAGTAAAAPNDPTTSVFVSEIHYDNDGTDAGEAVEVFGPAGTDLTGWTLVLYNGANGAAYDTDPLPAAIPDLGGGFGVVTVTYPANGIQNGSPDGVALVDNAGAVVQFLSYEGTFTATGGPANGLASVSIGVEEASTAPLSSSVKLTGTGRCPASLTWVSTGASTFGAIDPIVPSDACGGGEPEPEPELTPIHTIQGSGPASALDGVEVVVEGIVVADYEGPAPGMRGYFVQEEDADIDDDPTTSEGIFVFNGNLDAVSVGDAVSIVGTVDEFGGLTELTTATTTVTSSGNPLPARATIEFPVTSVSALEAFEGMVAELPQQLVISEYFNYDRFGEIVVALPAPGETRPMSPTALFAADSPEAAARADLNARSRITIDDGISTQNPETVIHPITRDQFSLDNAFRGGDTVTGLNGPIFEAFGLYRILPFGDGAGYASYDKTVAPVAPDPVGGSLRVASMNTLNFFVSLDTADTCGPTANLDCRGADDAGEFARQRVKLLNAIQGLDADVVGLNELENTPGVEPLADIVAGLNERMGAGTYEYVVAGNNSVVGTDAIKVGLIYRPAKVSPVGAAAVLDTPAFLDPNNTGLGRNRAAIAQTFRDNDSGEVFSVTVNHFKSKGSACDEAGETGLAGMCDVTRTLTAGVLANWIASSPTGVADTDWLIMGDLNSYDHEAPIGVLEGAGFTDLAKAYHGDLAYSYVFDGQNGYLDYALASSSIRSQVTGMTDWHINSDEPDVVDYDTGFKSAYQDSLFDPESPARASDHDAVVVGLDLDANVTVSASPSTIWLPLRQMTSIKLSAKGTPGTKYVVEPLSGTSNEADSGLGWFDLPNDIQIDNAKLKVRAEVFGCPARIYTIETRTSGGGQVVYSPVTVTVPNLLGLLLWC